MAKKKREPHQNKQSAGVTVADSSKPDVSREAAAKELKRRETEKRAEYEARQKRAKDIGRAAGEAKERDRLAKEEQVRQAEAAVWWPSAPHDGPKGTDLASSLEGFRERLLQTLASETANRGTVQFDHFLDYAEYIAGYELLSNLPRRALPTRYKKRNASSASIYSQILLSELKNFSEKYTAIKDNKIINIYPSVDAILHSCREITGNPPFCIVIMAYLNNSIRNYLNDLHQDDIKYKYRSRAELPDPAQRPDAEVNLRVKQVKLRMFPQVVEAVKQACDASGELQNEFLNRAVLQRLKQEFPELYEQLRKADLPLLRQGARPGIDLD